jgi:hypothetical protein
VDVRGNGPLLIDRASRTQMQATAGLAKRGYEFDR